jgi:hypothetical protein
MKRKYFNNNLIFRFKLSRKRKRKIKKRIKHFSVLYGLFFYKLSKFRSISKKKFLIHKKNFFLFNFFFYNELAHYYRKNNISFTFNYTFFFNEAFFFNFLDNELKNNFLITEIITFSVLKDRKNYYIDNTEISNNYICKYILKNKFLKKKIFLFFFFTYIFLNLNLNCF